MSTTRTSEYHVREDGIVVQTVTAAGGKMTLEDARANTQMFEQLAEGRKRRLLVDMAVPFSTEPGVRDYYASEEASRLVGAMAMVTPSSTSRIIGNFFLRINQPSYPCRLFSETHLAIAWLLQQPIER